jgi:3-oxoadipate enol-lactonase/4-carboxymuconolactone decarboxylase
MSPIGYAGCAAAIRDMRLVGRIHNIAVPTLVVTGMRDVSTPLAPHGAGLLAMIEGAHHLPLDCGHLAPLEAAETLAAGVLKFVEA